MKEEKEYSNVVELVSNELNRKSDNIGLIIRNGEEELVQAFITKSISDYVAIISSSKGMSTSTILAVGKIFTINKEVKQLKISEIKTFFNLAFVEQRYGKLYGAFGYDVLMEWFNTFMDERQQAIIEFRNNEHDRYTANEKQFRNRNDI